MKSTNLERLRREKLRRFGLVAKKWRRRERHEVDGFGEMEKRKT